MCAVNPDGPLSSLDERMRQFLIERAKKANSARPFTATITYGDLCAAIDPDQNYFKWPRFRGIGQVLGRISTFEYRQGRPMLSALVVQAGSLHAGDGFAGLGRDLGEQIQPGAERAFWRSQVEAVIQYWTGSGVDESASDPVAKARAILATVSGELQEVDRLLSTI